MNEQCDWCGRPTDQPIIYEDGNDISIICGNCFQLKTTCNACQKARECLFETSSSSLPKVIQKQVQQGPAVMMTTVKNPERIKETCEKGCPCYSEEFGCFREVCGFCNEYQPLTKGENV